MTLNTPQASPAATTVRDLRAQLAAAHGEIARLHGELAACAGASANTPPPPPSNTTKPLLRVRDIAAMLGVFARCVRRWREAGVLPPALEIEGIVRWRPESIDAWLEERERRA